MNNNMCSNLFGSFWRADYTRVGKARYFPLNNFENERELRIHPFSIMFQKVIVQNFDGVSLINFILWFLQLFSCEFVKRQWISLEYNTMACSLELNLNGRGIKKGGGVFI